MISPHPKTIVLIGPESTGKSTLCETLALHYNTVWCKEYAREYLLQNGTNYTYEDILTITKGQLALQQQAIQLANAMHPNPAVIILDTDMHVIKVWSEFVFGKCHNFVLQQAALQQHSLYLLCDTDLPWVKDELREYASLVTRQQLFLYYKDILVQGTTPWAVVSGIGEHRTNCAVNAVEQLRLNS